MRNMIACVAAKICALLWLHRVSCKESLKVFSGLRWSRERSHLHIANNIRNTLCAVPPAQMKLQIIPVLNKVFMRGLCRRPTPKQNWVMDRIFLISSLRLYTITHASTMGLFMLCNLALFNIESEILDSISNDKIINQALAGPHRILL